MAVGPGDRAGVLFARDENSHGFSNPAVVVVPYLLDQRGLVGVGVARHLALVDGGAQILVSDRGKSILAGLGHLLEVMQEIYRLVPQVRPRGVALCLE